MAFENKHIETALNLQRQEDAKQADEAYLVSKGWVKGDDNHWSKPDPLPVEPILPDVVESPVALPDAPEGEITPSGVSKVEEIDDTKELHKKGK